MSVTITSSQRIGLISGTSVTFSAPVVPEVTTDDIFDSANPSQTLTDILGAITSEKLVGTASIDGTTIANHTIFTVPSGKILIPTRFVFFLSDVAGSGGVPAINIGYSGSFNQYIDSTRDSTYTLASGVIASPGTGYTAADTLTLVGGTDTVVATVTASTVSSGAVTAMAVAAAGTYTVIPPNPVSVTGGSGTDFTLTATWAQSPGGLLSDITDLGQILTVSDFSETASSEGADYKYLSGGHVLTARIPFAATYSTYQIRCLAFGFLTEV